jgi:hypothetical protein
MKIKKIKSEG